MKKYNVTGMTCAACSARVEKAVRGVTGVTDCSVNLLTGAMGVEGNADEASVIAAVRAAGYGISSAASAPSAEKEMPKNEESATRPLVLRLVFSSVFLAALMYLSMGYSMWGWPLPSFLSGNPLANAALQMLLSLAVMVINQRFFISGFSSLFRRAPNMDTLVSLGSAAAFVYSICIFFVMTAQKDPAAVAHYLHDLYFESAAMILALITVGKMLEARAKGKTTDALRSLMRLAPQTATLLRDGQETTVPIAEVRVGDIFVVRPGDNIPVDGVVIEGESAVNEAALTGESIPVDKTAGSTVSAATTNLSGYLQCRASRVGEDTTLSQIIRMVSDATATKAPIAKVADRVSAVFVPIVLILSLVTAVVWLIINQDIGFALARAISVLVISCPCSLGLATPVAIMVGNGMGAKNGILFKTAAALEEAGRVSTVVLDKTGTVTAGEPRVTDICPADGISDIDLLTLAYTVEAKSEHPLARAICVAAEEKGIAPQESRGFAALAGNGVRAEVEGATVVGCSLSYATESATAPTALLDRATAFGEEGKTPLFFLKNQEVLGLIAVADTVKADSPQAIRELRDMGLRVVMLTGDNERTARAVGRVAGVDEVIAGVLPEGKEAAIRALQKEGKVAMVGDGINDAPALARADVGIAIGAGADVAIDAADVVLVKSRLGDLSAAVRLSRATLRNIKENLFWAFFYNSAGIPLAAGLFIPLLGWELNPMIAAGAMGLSSFCVVMNALRLNLFNLRDPRAFHKKRKNNKTIQGEQPMEITLKIEGMMCPHCEAHVKRALEELPAVETCVASHKDGTAILTLSADVDRKILVETVEKQGYRVVG